MCDNRSLAPVAATVGAIAGRGWDITQLVGCTPVSTNLVGYAQTRTRAAVEILHICMRGCRSPTKCMLGNVHESLQTLGRTIPRQVQTSCVHHPILFG